MERIDELLRLLQYVVGAEDLTKVAALKLAGELESAAVKLRKRYTQAPPEPVALEQEAGIEPLAEKADDVEKEEDEPSIEISEEADELPIEIKKEESKPIEIKEEEEEPMIELEEPDDPPSSSAQSSFGAVQSSHSFTLHQQSLSGFMTQTMTTPTAGNQPLSSQPSQSFSGPTYSTLYPPQLAVSDEVSRKRRREAEDLVSKIEKKRTFQCGCSYTDGEDEKKFSDNSKSEIKKLAPALKTNRDMFHYLIASALHRLKSCRHCIECPHSLAL